MYYATVETLCFGSHDGLEDLHKVTVTFEVTEITVRELISQAVEKQIECLNAEKAHSLEQRRKRLERQYLSAEDIETSVKQGRIVFPSDNGEESELDPAACVKAALTGFENNRYFIAIDGVRPTKLDDHVLLLPKSEVQFVRLIPLVGG